MNEERVYEGCKRIRAYTVTLEQIAARIKDGTVKPSDAKLLATTSKKIEDHLDAMEDD